MISRTLLTVYFLLDEAFSLFPGGDTRIPVGGAGATTYMLANELSKRSELRVVWLFSSGVDISNLQHPAIEARNYPPLVRAKLGPLAAYLNRRRMDSVYASDAPSVLVAPTWLLGWPMVVAAPRNGVPVLVRIHSDDDVVPSGATGGGGGRLLAACRSRSAAATEVPEVSMVAFLTEDQREIFSQQASCPSALIRQGWPISSEQPVRTAGDHILWVGSCRSLKRPLAAVDLARRLPDQRFVMVMPPFEGEVDELHSAVVAAAAELPNFELIARQIPIAEVDTLFARAKMFVNTSEVEGFPTTFLQAAATGTPVASLEIDPDGYIVREGVGVSADGDMETLVEGVRSAVEGDEWIALGRRHWEYARAAHSIEVCAEQLELAIRQCLEDR